MAAPCGRGAPQVREAERDPGPPRAALRVERGVSAGGPPAARLINFPRSVPAVRRGANAEQIETRPSVISSSVAKIYGGRAARVPASGRDRHRGLGPSAAAAPGGRCERRGASPARIRSREERGVGPRREILPPLSVSPRSWRAARSSASAALGA